MSQSYRVREFADLGGVTVKALLHYDRLGLLVPARTPAGHRRYSSRDLDRLRGILALKRIGVPLRQIGRLLEATPALLASRLREDRQVLARETERLRRLDHALAVVEESIRHAPADRTGLNRLADALDMERETAGMRRYFSDDVWGIAKRFYESWPTAEWIAFCRDAAAAMRESPDRTRALELVRRWNSLGNSVWSELPADPRLSRELHEGFARAWRDRQNWSDTLKRRFGDYRVGEIAAFVGRVSAGLLTSASGPGTD